MRGFITMLAAVVLLGISNPEARAICLFSCDPTEANARSVVENQIRSMFPNSTFQITKFNKTDGREMSLGGMKAYELVYSATVEFPNGFVPQNADLRAGGKVQAQLMQLVSVGGWRITQGDKIWERTVFEIRASTGFEKTEKGWRGEDGRVY